MDPGRRIGAASASNTRSTSAARATSRASPPSCHRLDAALSLPSTTAAGRRNASTLSGSRPAMPCARCWTRERCSPLAPTGRSRPMVPLMGIYAAATRRTLDGKNPDGWVPEQKITVAEAVHAYTIGSAYAESEERIKGSIAPGKLADLVVLYRRYLPHRSGGDMECEGRYDDLRRQRYLSATLITSTGARAPALGAAARTIRLQ